MKDHEQERLIPDEDFEFEKEQFEQEQRRAEEAIQAAETRKRRAAEEQRAYQKKLAQEKIELMKLKQGVIEQSEARTLNEDIAEEAAAEKMSFGKRIANFWYHRKLLLLFGAFTLFVMIYLIHSVVTQEDPDLTVIITVDNGLSLRMDELENFFEQYAVDSNGDGEVVVSVYNIPMNPDGSYSLYDTNSTKLASMIMEGSTILYITDPLTESQLVDYMDDVTADFPESKMLTQKGLSLNCALLREKLNWAEMPDDMYLGLRYVSSTLSTTGEKMQISYDKAMKVFEQVLADVDASATDEEAQAGKTAMYATTEESTDTADSET